MTFAIADVKENSCLFNEFGLDDSQEISVGIIDTKERKYPMEPMEDFDAAKVEKFLKTFVKGRFALSCLGLFRDVTLCAVSIYSQMDREILS